MSKPIIIIGSGLAGYHLVKEIRYRDRQVSIIVITQDAGDFYSKLMLSVALSMKKTPEALIIMTAEKIAEQYKIDVWKNTIVEEIIPDKESVVIKKISNCHFLENTQLFEEPIIQEYSSLILCLGADTPLIKFKGDAENDVVQVNSIYQYHDFYHKLINKKNITLFGAGLVGCEFANDLSKVGYNVHVVDPAISPLASLLPYPVSVKLRDALKNQGVQWHLGSSAKEIQQYSQYQIKLENGEMFWSDLVFSAIGLKPRIELAKRANIYTNRGILVDQYLRTNVPHIYAMGDCIELCPIVSLDSTSASSLKPGWMLPYVAPIMYSAKALAQTLTYAETALSLPPMTTFIKTSCYPIAICRPPFSTEAIWHIEENNNRLRGHLKDADKLYGFVLTEEETKESVKLAQAIKNWL